MACSPGMNLCIISIKIIHFPHYWSLLGEQLVTCGFPSQRAHGQVAFLLIYKGAAEQSVELPVARDAIAPMWRQCNGFGESNDSIQKAICRKSQWRHPMETFPRYWPFVRGTHRSPVNSPRKSQWRGALMFSLIRAWTNSWTNNGDAGDLRRHCAHYDVSVKVSKAFHHYMHYNPRFVRSVQVVEINH